MRYVKVVQRNADKAKRLILRFNLFDGSREVQHSRSYVYFPVLVMHAKAKKPFAELGASIVSRKSERAVKTNSYLQQLKRILTKEELDNLSKGYDMLGDIAIIEFKGSRKKESEIAHALMRFNNAIKTVLIKDGAVSGRYRIRKLRHIGGTRNYIANYRENNCTFRFDVRHVFFSNRLSYERSRILKLAKDHENIIVMFAGVGPFAIEIAKARKNANVVAIEMNGLGYKYMLKNIEINKTPNVRAVLGDVKRLSRKYRNFADRIIMPLPKSSMDFLDDAYLVARNGAVVHLYVFSEAGKLKSVYDKIREHASAMNYKPMFLNHRIVRPYSSSMAELAIDYRIVK